MRIGEFFPIVESVVDIIVRSANIANVEDVALGFSQGVNAWRCRLDGIVNAIGGKGIRPLQCW